MKLALRRTAHVRTVSPASSSDSDVADGLHFPTNRGNKLRSSARYTSTGHLDPTGGQARYKRKVKHAGYERYIIKKKPRLYDEDGDVIERENIPEGEDETLYGEPVSEDPFADVDVGEILRPLTSAAGLSEHRGLREGFVSGNLTNMCAEAAAMVREERGRLWRVKRLVERLRGDGGWVALGGFEAEGDGLLLGVGDIEDVGLAVDGVEEKGVLGLGPSASAVPSMVEGDGPADAELESAAPREEVSTADAMDGVQATDHAEPSAPAENGEVKAAESNGQLAPTNGDQAKQPTPIDTNPRLPNPTVTELANRASDNASPAPSSASASAAPSHAMTTRARARSPPPDLPSSPSPSDSASATIPAINPWFQFPLTALPDRDVGIPTPEAEDTRRLLLLYVQKQENIVRQLEALFSGLQKAERLRREVWRASRAEGHMVPYTVTAGDVASGSVPEGARVGEVVMRTEMSDGEDWYDIEEWGLQGWELKGGVELEKGKDEVEEVGEEEGGRRVGGRRRRVVGR